MDSDVESGGSGDEGEEEVYENESGAGEGLLKLDDDELMEQDGDDDDIVVNNTNGR